MSDPRQVCSGSVSGWRHQTIAQHDDVIKWKHFPRYWPFVRGIHRSTVNSPHKGHWRGALIFSLICVWINGYVNNREASDLRRYRAHYDVSVMQQVMAKMTTNIHDAIRPQWITFQWPGMTKLFNDIQGYKSLYEYFRQLSSHEKSNLKVWLRLCLCLGPHCVL